jgi:hypothetical protein
MARIRALGAQNVRIPLDTPASDSTFGAMTSFALIDAKMMDDDGETGAGFPDITGHNGGALQNFVAMNPATASSPSGHAWPGKKFECARSGRNGSRRRFARGPDTPDDQNREAD